MCNQIDPIRNVRFKNYLLTVALGLLAVPGLSLVSMHAGYSWLHAGFSSWWLPLWSMGSRAGRLQGRQAPGVVVQGLSCPPTVWDLPGSGIEPVSPALAGGFSSTVPLGEVLTCVR